MPKTGPIMIIEDDIDDQEFFKEAWDELQYPNPLKFFKRSEEVLQYLKQEDVVPFLIISDVSLPKMNGFELKKKLLEDHTINHRTIPFIFFSDSASNEQIVKSYDLGSNGFFMKGRDIEELKSILAKIFDYWQKSRTPE